MLIQSMNHLRKIRILSVKKTPKKTIEMTDSDNPLSEEHIFINLQVGNKELKYARQHIVNRKFGNVLFSNYNDDRQVVGFTLNQKKTKVIRIFFNKHNRPEGDHVSESTHYPIKIKKLNMLHPFNSLCIYT